MRSRHKCLVLTDESFMYGSQKRRSPSVDYISLRVPKTSFGTYEQKYFGQAGWVFSVGLEGNRVVRDDVILSKIV